MKYYIEETKWKQIFKYLRSVKGVHSKNEEGLRMFIEAVWYIVRSGCQRQLLPEVYIGDLKSGVKREFGKIYSNIRKIKIWKCT